MIRLRVHNPCNAQSRFYCTYNLIWDLLTERLARSFTVEENRRAQRTFPDVKDVRLATMDIQLQAGTTGKVRLRIHDYIIENLDNSEFVGLCYTDHLTVGMLQERANPKFLRALIAQWLPSQIHAAKEHSHKYVPWLYCQMKPSPNLDVYYYLRKYQTPQLIDKLCFRGQTSYRPIMAHFDPRYVMVSAAKVPLDKYFAELITYKAALAVGGGGEFCFRDVECMAVGVPFIRFEYRAQMNPPLVPDVHYISVKRPAGLDRDKEGGPAHARLLEQRFLEVKDDSALLARVAQSARDYYTRYLALPAAVEHTMKLLNIESEWL